MHHRLVATVAAALALGLGACVDAPTAPLPAGTLPDLAAVKFWDAGSSLAWNKVARDLLVARGAPPFVQSRVLSYLSVAQYNAVVAAEAAAAAGQHPSPAFAAAGASITVLKYFYPLAADHAMFDARLTAQQAAPGWPGEQSRNAAAGEALGRAVGAAVVAYAAADGIGLTVPVPQGPGPAFWVSSLNPPQPAALFLHGVRPFALESGDQFRPAPPPEFGSAEFLAALAEVRTISQTRTAEQVGIAQKWAARGPAYWNEQAAAMIVAHRQNERKAAHTLALANMAGFDALIACWDAKFHYWTARPTKVDPAITLAVPLPNFPSYPSGHSCISGAYVALLGNVFPEETDQLEAQLDEVGRARVFGGLHYQFDCDVGRVLGREVADLILETDGTGHQPIPLD